MDTLNTAKWIDELAADVAKLKRATSNVGGSGVTTTTTIGEFPSNPKEGDIHYLLDSNGRENAAYLYNGESWVQIFGFDYDISTAASATIISGYGLFDTIKSGAVDDFKYVIGELGYQLRTGGGNFVTYFYIDENIIFDLDTFTGFEIKGKFRGVDLDETITFDGNITSGYCGKLCIAYHTDSAGNWLTWEVCRPFLIETNNSALPHGTIKAKAGGSSGDFIITSLKLIKKTTTRKRGTKK